MVTNRIYYRTNKLLFQLQVVITFLIIGINGSHISVSLSIYPVISPGITYYPIDIVSPSVVFKLRWTLPCVHCRHEPEHRLVQIVVAATISSVVGGGFEVCYI